jgi:hypothetical protein
LEVKDFGSKVVMPDRLRLVGAVIMLVCHLVPPIQVFGEFLAAGDPAPRNPVLVRVWTILLHTLVIPAIFGLLQCCASSNNYSRATLLNVDQTSPHPGITDAQLEKVEPWDKTGGVRRELIAPRLTVKCVGIRVPGMSSSNMQSLEYRKPGTQGHNVHRTAGVEEEEPQMPEGAVAEPRLRLDIHHIRLAKIATGQQEIWASCGRGVLATAVAGKEVEIRKVSTAPGVDVAAACISKVRSPDISVIPSRDEDVVRGGENVPATEGSTFRNCVR